MEQVVFFIGGWIVGYALYHVVSGLYYMYKYGGWGK